MKKSYKIALVVTSFLVLAGILFGLYLYNLGSKDLQKVKPDFILSAEDLVKAFESDENTATTKYINKVIEVSGTIQSIKSGENNTVNISLKTGSELSSVICTLQGNPDISDFSTGEQITIRGECSGFLMDVLLNNCVAVQAKK
jgi:hypothetical protein